jgi:lipopolysaccharide/colanic/teichoic acid biosynthesis glycosyltransferase
MKAKSPGSATAKRLLDVALGGVALLVLLPLLAAIAVAVLVILGRRCSLGNTAPASEGRSSG